MSIRRSRVAAATLAAATVLASTTTAISVLVPSPAHAAVTGTVESGTATWGLSAYLNSANFGRPNPLPAAYAAPATFDATTRLTTWGAGTGLVAPDGSADLVFDGTSVNFTPTGGGWLRLSDVTADLDAAGNGTVSALVEYGTSVTGTSPAMTYDPAQAPTRSGTLPIVTLSGNTAADRTLGDGTAAWTGLDGLWTTDLTTFLAGAAATETSPAIPGWTYASTVTNTNPASGSTRTPEPFAFSVATEVPEVTAAITGASYSQGVDVSVTGTGFRAVTNPGDAGVYAGIAEAGGLPDVSSPAGIGAFLDAAYITPPALATGDLSATLNAATADLDPTKDYSVYTWQAHAHSNTSQDTETPLDIDFAALEPLASSVTVAGATSQVYGTGSTVTAAVPAAGSVVLTGLGADQTADAVDGVATFTVPADLAAGDYTPTFTYSGGGDYAGAAATTTYAVTQAGSTTRLTIDRKPGSVASGKAGKATVRVTGPAAVAKPAGAVVVKLTKPGGKTRIVTGTLNNGGGVVLAIPALGKGAWTAVATYAGTDNLVTSKQTKRFTVR